jgi:peroxiredoxin
MAALRTFLVICVMVSTTTRAGAQDRAAEFAKLIADYEADFEAFHAQDSPPERTSADKVEFYKSYPRWSYLPKILALAESEPRDATTLAACRWIIEQANQIGPQWSPLFDAEKRAWQIAANQALSEHDLTQFSLLAAARQSPAREAFLRELARRTDLPGNAPAFVTTALAGYLSRRQDDMELGGFEAWWPTSDNKYFDTLYYAFLRTQIDDDWIDYEQAGDAEPYRLASIEQFRRVLDKYADIPVGSAADHFSSSVTTLGENATSNLYALENLYIGAPAPRAEGVDLDGNPLRLSDYRGKVVVLSFWFTGCGPCIEQLPEEKALIEKFRDQPFALLSVARDRDVADSKKTAAEHGITWPTWFDKYPGEIVKQFDVRGYPTFYLLDADGRIVSKRLGRGELASAVDAVLRRKPPEAP